MENQFGVAERKLMYRQMDELGSELKKSRSREERIWKRDKTRNIQCGLMSKRLIEIEKLLGAESTDKTKLGEYVSQLKQDLATLQDAGATKKLLKSDSKLTTPYSELTDSEPGSKPSTPRNIKAVHDYLSQLKPSLVGRPPEEEQMVDAGIQTESCPPDRLLCNKVMHALRYNIILERCVRDVEKQKQEIEEVLEKEKKRRIWEEEASHQRREDLHSLLTTDSGCISPNTNNEEPIDLATDPSLDLSTSFRKKEEYSECVEKPSEYGTRSPELTGRRTTPPECTIRDKAISPLAAPAKATESILLEGGLKQTGDEATEWTGLDHGLWKEESHCEVCNSRFVFTRRHHCRRCGRCVCSTCSPFRLPLPIQEETRGQAMMQRNVNLRRSGSASDLPSDPGAAKAYRVCSACV